MEYSQSKSAPPHSMFRSGESHSSSVPTHHLFEKPLQRQMSGNAVSIVSIVSSQARRRSKESLGVSLPIRLSKSGLPSCLEDDDCDSLMMKQLPQFPILSIPPKMPFQEEIPKKRRTRRHSLTGGVSTVSGGPTCRCRPQSSSVRPRRYSLPLNANSAQGPGCRQCSSLRSRAPKHGPPTGGPRSRLPARLRMPLLTIDEMCEFGPARAPFAVPVTDGSDCWTSGNDEAWSEDDDGSVVDDQERGWILARGRNLAPFVIEEPPCHSDLVSSPPVPIRQLLDSALNAEAPTLSLLKSPTRPVRRLSIENSPILCEDGGS
jgi:hypothetical protein